MAARRSFTCNECDENFTRLTNLVNHMKWKHIKKSRDRQLCAKCGKSFRDRFNLKRHYLKVHESQSTCMLCDFRSFEKELNDHYRVKHGVVMDIQNHSFQNESDFTTWKNQIETDTSSKYVKGPTRFNKSGSTVMYFRCHRDGYFKSKSNNLRSMKAVGSNKINSKCPSHMRVCFNNTISVKFVATHVGHFQDLCRLSLTQDEKDDIANQISSGVHPDEILDNIRNTIPVDNNVRRLHLTTKRDINNIISSYGLAANNIKKVANSKIKIPSCSLQTDEHYESQLKENHKIVASTNKIIEIPTYRFEELNYKEESYKIEEQNSPIKEIEENVEITENIIESNYNTYPNVIIEFEDSQNTPNLDKRKSQFLDKIHKMLNLVDNDNDMESVLKHAAPLESVIRNLKNKRHRRHFTNLHMNHHDKDETDDDQYEHDDNESNLMDEMGDETESIAYEIVIE